jgi:hypothetical protein
VPPVRRAWILGAWLVGCSDAPVDDPTPAATPAATSAQTELVSLLPRPPASIAVQDRGAEPREVFALAPAPGTEETLQITLSLRMIARASGQELPPMAMPPVTFAGRMFVDTVDADTIAARHIVDEVVVGHDDEVPAALDASVRAAAGRLVSYRASLQLDPHGGLLGGSVEVPSGVEGPVGQVLQQVTDSFAQIQVPLPREPIGVGARWQATTRVDQGGMVLRQRVDYELAARDGARLHVVAKIRQSLLDPHVAVEGVPGATADVELFSATGRGSMTIDLDHLVPWLSEQTLDVRMVMNVAAGGAPAGQQEIALHVDARVTRQPGASAPAERGDVVGRH